MGDTNKNNSIIYPIGESMSTGYSQDDSGAHLTGACTKGVGPESPVIKLSP